VAFVQNHDADGANDLGRMSIRCTGVPFGRAAIVTRVAGSSHSCALFAVTFRFSAIGTASDGASPDVLLAFHNRAAAKKAGDGTPVDTTSNFSSSGARRVPGSGQFQPHRTEP